jgi:hypothetical protein
MRRIGRLLLGLLVLALGFLRDRTPQGRKRIVPPGDSQPRVELAVIALLLLAALAAVAFIVVYAIDSIGNHTQLLGIALGLCLGLLATALILVGKHLVVTEEVEQSYHEESPEEQEEIAQIVRESGSRFTRKRLIKGAAGTAGAALGLAATRCTPPRGGAAGAWSTRTAGHTWPPRSSRRRSTPRSRRAPRRTRSARRSWWCGSTRGD